MSSPNQLKKKFLNLLSLNPSIFEWLTEDNISGYWVTTGKFPRELYVNEAFIKNIGYSKNESAEEIVPFKITREVETQVKDIIRSLEREEADEEKLLCFSEKSGAELYYQAFGKKISSSTGDDLFIIKFQKSLKDENVKDLGEVLRKYENLQAIYLETNELAKVGGWEMDLESNTMTWTKVTKDIHEVEQDYQPVLGEGINFYSEGWSRDKVKRLYADAVEKGIPFDAELKILTAKNNEIWVRSFGKPEFRDGICVRVYGAFQDINDKKENQLEYEKTREQYEMIFKNSSVGILLVKPSGELLQINPATLKIFDFEESDRQEVMNLTFKDLIHPDFLEEALSKREKLLSGEIDKYKLESKFYNKYRNVKWCRTHTSIIRSTEQDKTLIITQVEDITDKKELELRVSENIKRFQIAFDYSPIGKGLVSPEDEWQMVNQRLAGMFGYTKKEFLNLKLNSLTHPEDREKDSSLLKALLKGEINTYSIEKRFTHKTGKTIFGLLNVSAVVDDDGKLLYLIMQISDLTERVISEKALQKSLIELQSLLNATTHVSIIQTDLKGVVLKFNKGAENFLGYNAEEAKNILNVKKFHEENEIELRGKELSEKYGMKISGFEVFTFQAKRRHYDIREWTYVRKDGTKFPVQLVVTAIKNYKGEISGYLGVATDISQLKEMESSLIRAKKKAEAANKYKSEFLANMSHEIRTPLNGIIGFTDLLMRTELENSQQKYMQTIYNSANSLMDIINDVLDFSKIEAGKLELNKERTDLIALCDQTMDIIKHQAHNKGLEVLLNISPSLRRYVYADAVRLRQILTNLLGNAVKFTNEGEIELNISSQPISGNQHEWLFTFLIRDTGIGIAPKNLKKIFHAFDQEDASTTRKYGGSGLGLTISNKLLKLMDSKLEVKSLLNEGSTFSFKVKLKTEEEVTYSSIPPKTISSVLVVDDNTNNRVILKEMLAANNIDIVECANGIEALQILSQEHQYFDLAIIDYNMPYMDGLSLIGHIRNQLNKNADELPIILLHSSTEDEEIISGCKELNVHHHMNKPIQIHTLFNMIDSIEKPANSHEVLKTKPIPSLVHSKMFNVLIVEDNPVNKFLANSIIKKILPNAHLLQAENGKEAVILCEKDKLDIIFMDIQMPVMGGCEATSEIRKSKTTKNANTPIIALTARAVKDEKERCLEAGMNDYLPKPVVLEDIRVVINEYLNLGSE